MSVTYALRLELGKGGISANPASYSKESSLTLSVPLRPGYRFVGWMGEGLDEPQLSLTIPKGSEGDRSYVAQWVPVEPKSTRYLLPHLTGKDDGIAPRPNNAASLPTARGERGEDVYEVRTVYTEITVDGKRDAAYDYGVHFTGELPSDKALHEENPCKLDLWVVRGQDGYAYAYGEVVDSDLVVNEEMFAFKAHHCDSFHFYAEPDSHGMCAPLLAHLIGSEEMPYASRRPKNSAVRRTATGFAFELAFDNQGYPFFDGEKLGFSLYYNNSNEYHSTSDYKHLIVKLPSGRNPVGEDFRLPQAKDNDTLCFSTKSATGIPETSLPSTTSEDPLQGIFSGARPVCLLYGARESAHTVLEAWKLRMQLAACGVTVYLKKEGADVAIPENAVTVHMGRTSHADSRSWVDAAPYNAYGLRFSGDAIYLLGWKEAAMKNAFALLSSALAYVEAGGDTATLAKEYRGALSDVPVQNLPPMEDLALITDAGASAYLLLSENREPEAFDRYAARLVENGFVLTASNRMASVLAATYVCEDVIVNLTYGERDRSLRAVVDSRRETILPPAEVAPYVPLCTNEILQLAPSRVFFMSYAIRLDNGEYLVIDAGGNGVSQYLHDTLLAYNGGRPVVVAAWIFTHFHCDHIGGLLDLMEREELRRDFVIKTIVHNFPQKQVLDTASPGDQSNLRRWPNVVALSGAAVCHARTGQTYRFGNATVEMLFTYEDLAPFYVINDRTNPTSHIFTVTVAGQRLLFMGDACGEATSLAVLRYGEYLKCDFVQLSHHGYGDGGTDPRFYPTVGARWVLLPSVETMHLSPVEKQEAERAERVFRNGDRDTLLPLPYAGE